MRTRTLCAVSLGLLLITGCSGNDARVAVSGTPSTAVSPREAPSPRLGGAPVRSAQPPPTPLDELEQPIASHLAGEVHSQGLTLDYLDCPDWDGEAPEQLTCHGFFDGVTAAVRVRLTESPGGAVDFDATLQNGVIATQKLVRRLTREGYTHVDCGGTPAYPSQVGRRLVCSVRDGGRQKLVVAKITDRSGAVDITDY